VELTLWPRGGLWRDADFLRLWGAATVSQVGSQISLIALPLVAVLVLEASAFQVALLTTFDFLPFLLFGLPAGVWVDRLPRRPVMIATDLGRAVALLTIPLAYTADVLTLGQLYAVGFLVGVMTVFFELAHASFVPSLVERRQLIEGNSKLEISRSAAYIGGPGLGGVLVEALRAPGAIVVDAASFIVSALFVLRIRVQERQAARARPRSSLRRELAEGLRYVAGHRYLAPIAACTDPQPVLQRGLCRVLRLPAERARRRAGRDRTRPHARQLRLVGGSAPGRPRDGQARRRVDARRGGLPVLPLPRPDRRYAPTAPLPFLIAAQGLGSFAGVLYTITSMTLRQSVTPDRLQGRTVGAIRTVVWGVTPLGALLGGILASVVGLRATFWIAAAGGATAALPIVLSPARSLRRMPEPKLAT
jgi:MFS family permease